MRKIGIHLEQTSVSLPLAALIAKKRFGTHASLSRSVEWEICCPNRASAKY
jgi:hypothetical protein